MSNSITVERTKIECIKISFKDGDYAHFTLDYGDGLGRLSIASSYGNWSYYWGACGESFKRFVSGLGKDYVAGKFGESRYFDKDASIKELKGYIKEYTSEYEDKLEALNYELTELEDCDSSDSFGRLFFALTHMPRVCDYPPMNYDISPNFNKFWSKVWPEFLTELKKDINIGEITVN